MMNRVNSTAHFTTGVAKHQVHVKSGEVIEIFADGKKEARSIIESYGYKVMFVTRFV